VDEASRRAELDVAYAPFDHDTQIGEACPTEADVWKAALRAGLIADIPVADEAGGQILPRGYCVKWAGPDLEQPSARGSS
jgi:hypothetical protein